MSIQSLLNAVEQLPKKRVSMHNTDPKDAKALYEIRCHAEGVHIAAIEGLKGLGAVTAIAADHTDAGVSPHDINRIGWLLVEIAEILDLAHEYGAVGTEPLHQ